MENKKRCSGCGVLRLKTLFFKENRDPNDLFALCSKCRLWGRKMYKRKTDSKLTKDYYQRKKKKKSDSSKRKSANLWKKRNPEKIREYKRKYYEKYPSAKINRTISRGIYKSLKGKKKGKRWEDLVGYTLEELKQHLEAQFEPWMTWENYGEWHIDHIKPKSLFNFTSPEDKDFKECWALNNLQPLGAAANIEKSNKY